jgi:hypothetical protein
MPRIEFEDLQEMWEWLSTHFNSGQYELYATPTEVIAAPTKSTRQLLYASAPYVQTESKDMQFFKEVEKKFKTRPTRIEKWFWSVDRPSIPSKGE